MKILKIASNTMYMLKIGMKNMPNITQNTEITLYKLSSLG